MAESWANGLKTPVNGLLQKKFNFGPLFGYHNFQNQIDTWETTVQTYFFLHRYLILKQANNRIELSQ